MMPRWNQKRAFTLLELVLVVIIIGVLASLAIPRLATMVERARVAEFYQAVGILKPKIEECIHRGAAFGNVNRPCVEDLLEEASETMGETYFDYRINVHTGNEEGLMEYSIIATRNSYKNGLDVIGEIEYYGGDFDGDGAGYCATDFYEYVGTGIDCPPEIVSFP